LFHPKDTENSGKIAIVEASVPEVPVKTGALPGINPEIKARLAPFVVKFFFFVVNVKFLTPWPGPSLFCPNRVPCLWVLINQD
jgi:hypothetical protein